jgi:hypothetical protein
LGGLDGFLALDISGVQGTGGLKEEHVSFLGRDWPMFRASRDDDEFAFCYIDIALTPGVIAVVHPERPVNDKKHLIFRFVTMPDEFTLKLHELDVLPVQLSHDLRAPQIVKGRKFVSQRNFLHTGQP